MIKRHWKKLAAAAAALVVIAGLWLARPRPPPAPAWEATPLDRGDVVVKVTASGTLAARRTVVVSSQVSGRVAELAVDYNGRVRKGQLLARIDPQPFQAAVAQATASAAAAGAQVSKARASLADLERQSARSRELLDRGLLAREEWDASVAQVTMSKAELAAAEAGLAQARAALDEARYKLTQTDIRSSIDGIVVSRDVDVGQTVAASLQAPTLFTLAEDLSLMEVRAHVSESDVGKISEGMAATFKVDAFPREVLQGRVRQVRNAATTTQSVVTYDVVVDVENPALKLKPGMTATVTFVAAERRDALRAPNAALRFKPPAGAAPPAPRDLAADQRVIYLVEAERLSPVTVRLGVSDGAHTELLDAQVPPGALVATGSASADGAGSAAATAKRSQAPGGPGGPPPPRMF
ncbi:MAG: efflux RND transporter periplasmic adaptor subunit [Anaeromyxobacter sp.]